MVSRTEDKRNRCLRLKLVGIFRRNRPRKAPGKQAHTSIVVIIKQGIITPGTEFRYDGSSTGRHFPKPVQAVLGHSSHKDCKGVIDVLKEESTREITAKVSPTAKEKQNQVWCARKLARCQQAESRRNGKRPDEQAKSEAQGAGLQHPKITPTCQSKQEAGCGPCWKQISLRAGA